MNALPRCPHPALLPLAALLLGAGALPVAAQTAAVLPVVSLAPPPAGVVVATPRVVQHGDHLAVVAMIRHGVQTAKVRQGQLVARYRLAGAASDTVASARCDVHRWQEACTVALPGLTGTGSSAAALDGTAPQQVTIAFQPRA